LVELEKLRFHGLAKEIKIDTTVVEEWFNPKGHKMVGVLVRLVQADTDRPDNTPDDDSRVGDAEEFDLENTQQYNDSEK
jgi:hypothetical protein